MSLVKLKLKEGYQYGDIVLGGQVPNIHETKATVDRQEEPAVANSPVDAVPKTSTVVKTISK